nr:BnaA09g04740D [Ipomoea trifida]
MMKPCDPPRRCQPPCSTAFRCLSCDAKIHAANKLASRHARVWVYECEVCKQIQVSFTCKGDVAALCVTWDRDIHSANPVARHHKQLPVNPEEAEDEAKAASWMLLTPVSGTVSQTEHFLYSPRQWSNYSKLSSIVEDPLDYKNSSSCTNNDMGISGISHDLETTNRKKNGGGFLPGIMLSLSNRRKGAPSRFPLS